MTPRFVPGLDLARDFYGGVIRPLPRAQFPGLAYAAALLGPGSDVAWYNTERSTDHDWGPRLQVFLTKADAPPRRSAVTHRRRPLGHDFAERVSRHRSEVNVLN
jgi:hypothetical protein